MTEIAFLKPKAVEMTIQTENGEEQKKFYPLSINAYLKLKTLAKPITLGLTQLFATDEKDNEKLIKDFNNIKEGLTSSETHIHAAPLETLKFRASERERAIGALVESLFEDSNINAIVGLIVDSMRDDFRGMKLEDVRAQLTIPTMVEMLKGVVAANKNAFGPLALKLTEAIQKLSAAASPAQSQGSEPKSPQPEGENAPSNQSLVLVKD